jgi:hypothetical protein
MKSVLLAVLVIKIYYGLCDVQLQMLVKTSALQDVLVVKLVCHLSECFTKLAREDNSELV